MCRPVVGSYLICLHLDDRGNGGTNFVRHVNKVIWIHKSYHYDVLGKGLLLPCRPIGNQVLMRQFWLLLLASCLSWVVASVPPPWFVVQMKNWSPLHQLQRSLLHQCHINWWCLEVDKWQAQDPSWIHDHGHIALLTKQLIASTTILASPVINFKLRSTSLIKLLQHYRHEDSLSSFS